MIHTKFVMNLIKEMFILCNWEAKGYFVAGPPLLIYIIKNKYCKKNKYYLIKIL